MRTITSLTTIFALTLGLTACGDDKNGDTTNDPTTNSTPATASASETAGTTSEPGTTTDPGTSEPTGGSTDPTATTTTEPATSSSTDPTATTTTEPATSSSTDPGTSTGGPGGEAPYQACVADADCGDGICINAMTTGGQIKGSFCSPKCFGPGKICPVAADGVKASQGAQCIFGPMGMSPTNCALICQVGVDECGPESDCEDIGQAPMMGVTLGVCSVPA